MEWSGKLERSVEPALQALRGGVGMLIPNSAFQVSRRDVSVSGSGGALVGKRLLQLPGVIVVLLVLILLG